MKPRIAEILAGMQENRNERQVSVQLGLAAELQALISEDQSESAAKMERQTRVLVRLTWGLFWLTLVLTLVAAVQIYVVLKQN